MIQLSILMPSIPQRKEMFDRLFTEVANQSMICYKNHPTLGRIEILSDNTKSFRDGGMSIGEKRDSLIKKATGNYLCFLDDDESISPDYVETLMRLCYENEDVCTFRSIAKLTNNWALIDMSLFNSNQQINPEGITNREPWHICPVRSEYAKLYSFDNINYGEDWNWFNQVLKHCHTEAKTSKIIHQYNHGAHSEADKIK